MSKKKVLLTKYKLESDGATKVIYDLISAIQDHNDDIHFDWFLYSPDGHTNARQFKDMGCSIYLDKNQRERKQRSKLLYHLTKYIRIIKFLKKQHYDVIHINTDNMFRFDMLLCARIAGIPVRMIHSHNSQSENTKGYRGNKLLQNIARKCIDHTANVKLACSESAAEWMYSKKSAKEAVILKNGIDTERFSFNAAAREAVRKELGLSDDITLLGNVGRFSEQKNHRFLIQVFSELNKLNPSVRLLLIGEGELYDSVKAEVRELGLEDKVMMPGTSDRVNQLYFAMDIFVMTSSFEGLPLVGVEAQTAGLECVFSDAITDELKVTDKARFISLDKGSRYWAEEINNIIKDSVGTADRFTADTVRACGYDKNRSAMILEQIYNQ